jgi:hypothetical protein
VKNIFFHFAVAFSLLLPSFTAAEAPPESPSPPPIYSTIKDIHHPTTADYLALQEYLRSDARDLSLLGDCEWITKNINIIGTKEDEQPRSGVAHVHCTDGDKENCIITYATFNRNYPKALDRLVDTIKNSDFKGDVLYRVGGWPNTEQGDLVLSHVPYAFKVCFFKEAQRLGYKRCLWLDTSIVPVASLNDIFATIKEKGYLALGPVCPIGPYMNPSAAGAFGLTIEEVQSIPSCAAFIFGVDFTSKIGTHLIDAWYSAAKDPHAFFSRRSDQNALSIILFQAGISDFISLSRLPHTEIGEPVQADSLFIVDRLFAHHKQ